MSATLSSTTMPVPARASAPEAGGPLRVRPEDFGKGTPDLDRAAGVGTVLGRPYPMGRTGVCSLRALARIACPDAIDVPDLEERVETRVRTMMRYMPRPAAWGLRFGFMLVDWAPRLLFRSVRRLRNMPIDRARALFHELCESSFTPVRTLMYAVRGILLSTYFDFDEVHRELGYTPAPFMKQRISLRNRLLEGVGASESDMIPTTAVVEG